MNSDADVQFENRYAHWILAFDIWKDSRFIGIGINSHVFYMANTLTIGIDSPIMTFLIRSPIHNIHMIVLAETGVIGLFYWLYFYISRINMFSNSCHGPVKEMNIVNITYCCVLISCFLYGFFGWAPFHAEIYTICIIFGFYAVGKKRV